MNLNGTTDFIFNLKKNKLKLDEKHVYIFLS